jgi:glycerophosphoryl diester phosphodiesterase
MLAALLLAVGCREASGDAPRVRYISHRGESLAAPENTMAAFRAAAEKGADGFECDVYLTKDNEIVCMHDKSAKRTTGADLAVTNATLAELRALDAGSWKGPQFTGERVPTLAEALSLARDAFEIFVEVKCGVEIVPRLAEVMAAEPKATPERVLFICFNTNVVAALRQRLPAYRAYWLTSPKLSEDGSVTPTAASTVATAKACRASGIDAKATDALSAAYVREVQAAGLSFHVWTVNSVQQADKLAAMGVQTVTSDCGATLVALQKPRPKGLPVVHWTFDGVAANSGSGGPFFDAALSGAPAYTNGVAGLALALDGVDDFASAAYPFQEQGTMSLWYRPEAFYNFNTVLDNARNADQWELWIQNNGRLRFRMGKESGEITYDLSALGGAGRWYHLALAWDNVSTNMAKLYVDGVERDSGAIGGWVAPGGMFHIGGGNAGNTKGKGAVDDVRVYEVPLSAAQIRALYEAAP